jgi:hypothetical protein
VLSRRKPAALALALVIGLGACDAGSSREEYARQLSACSLAESNGLLDAAVQACGAALAIAEKKRYATDAVAALLLRVGRLERQRGNFAQVEVLLLRSLALAEAADEPRAEVAVLLELAPVLAGQDRWLDGVQMLERAMPLLAGFNGEGRRSAADVFRAFGVRLALLGHDEQAEWCTAAARELAASP